MKPLPDSALSHPALWRGRDCARVATPSVPTGFAEFDVQLPGGGWPREVLTEIYIDRPGIGELRILMPALARLTRDEHWLAMIGPPHVPYAPALLGQGVRLSRVMLIRPQAVDAQLWAGEQALRSGSCAAVLLWLNRAPERALRRLQLAAEGSGALVLLLRAARVAPFVSAALRLHVSKTQGRTVVRILKRRGGGLPAPVVLDLQGMPARFAASSPPACLQHPAPLQAAL